MVKEKGEKFVYRPQGDANYAKQLGPMKKFEDENPEREEGYGLEGYRLHSKTFYFAPLQESGARASQTRIQRFI